MQSHSSHASPRSTRFLPGLLLLCLFFLCGLASPLSAQLGAFTTSSDGSGVTITGYSGAGGNVTIPSQFGGLPVQSIGSGAFLNCVSLTGVTIPASVTSIDSNAFGYCTHLSGVTIPGGVASIGSGAFQYCSSLASVTMLSGVASIGDSAFSQCTQLTSVTIPASVTSIGDDAFGFCSSLATVTIPAGVTHIGDGCSSIAAA
jgi:hypothetical protein